MSTIPTKPPDGGGLIADLKLLPKPFYLLVTGSFINRFGHFVVPFLAIYLRQLGFPASLTGYTLAAYGAGGFCASFIGGYLADSIGRKPTLLISCFGGAAAMLLLSVAKTPAAFISGSFLCGLMTCIYYPASSSLIADLIGKELRVRAYAVQRFSINLAFALGMMTAGLVASTSFFWLFIADAGTTLVLGLIILFGLVRGIGRKSEANAGWREAVSSIVGNAPFLRAAFASLLVAVIFWQTSSTLGLQVTEISKLDEKAFGFLLGLNGIMIVCLELPLTNWTRRFDPQRTMAFGYCLVGFGLALLAFGSGVAMLVTSMVILTFGEMVSMPVASSYVANLAPDNMRGRYMGVLGLSWNMAVGIGPLIGLQVFAHSPQLLWLLCGVIGIAAAGTILVGKKSAAGIPVPARDPV